MKKKTNIFLRLLFLLFLGFCFLYVMSKTGYYESTINKKTVLTEEKIREFENDVKEGKKINIDHYYVPKKVDYSSLASKLGKQATLGLSKSLKIVFDSFGKVLKKLF